MSKGMDRKREQKRKPEKTLTEKRAAKKAKKGRARVSTDALEAGPETYFGR